ncbi:MAG TPA: hypothetical protein VGB82_06695 [Alphaproteobacteria bacterium]
MQIFDEPDDSASDRALVAAEGTLAPLVPSVRDGWVAAREGYADNSFELRPDTGLIPGPRQPVGLA